MTTQWKIIRVVVKEYFSFKQFVQLNNRERAMSPIPDRFVESILSLGPAFIKLGQILSTRPDLLPEEYISALEKLQENVPPIDFKEVEKIIVSEFHKPLFEVFKEFENKPVASASLSQVHFAVLHGGEKVAIKIQRPGLGKIINDDLTKLGKLFTLARIFNRKLYENLNIQKVFSEFKRYTLQELDFEVEGKTYDRFRENFKGNRKVIFPQIFWSYTTSRVLTMSRVEGLRLWEAVDKIAEEKRRELNTNIVETLIQMFVKDGFFHADLHPGNVFFRGDGTIAFVDVGMYGELTTEQKERFILYWLAIALKDKDKAFKHLLEFTHQTTEADETGYHKAYLLLLDAFYSSTIREKSLTQTYLEILLMGAKYGFVFPSDMLLQAKALTTAEHIGYILLPEFNFADTAKPFIVKALSERFTSDNIIERLSNSFPEWLLLGESAEPTLLNNNHDAREIWVSGSEHIAKASDKFHNGDYEEIWHGEYSVEIDKDLASVFNFVTRFAQYPLWHPIYTNDSHVIHVSGQYIFTAPEVIGSVFRLDEIVDGYHLLSNAVITDFERNRLLKWKAPFSILPVIELGTCLNFKRLGDGRTELSEYFFFSESPLKHLFINRKWFSVEALTNHIREELTGVKNILEAGNYEPEETDYLWENLDKPVRFMNGKTYAINHENGGPIPHLRRLNNVLMKSS